MTTRMRSRYNIVSSSKQPIDTSSLEILESELTCLFTGLQLQDASGSHLFPRTRTHVYQPDSHNFTLFCLNFVQTASTSSLISVTAETNTSTALVCPKHAVLSLSVLTCISGAAGSFCRRRSSSFVRSGMRETLAIYDQYIFIQLALNETQITLRRKQFRAASFRNGQLWQWQVEPASIGETGSKSTSRNWNNVSLFSSASTAVVLERKLDSSVTLGTSWLTRVDHDK
ncbi:Hypothetical_protein [Hexamita inflata]|uniref:Hypothetical_protein n=1 Tax=Hexamita inflata TaxID=28002 RepID=A0AA86N8L0_9EUKA|nr:Hypothetical protein HINF_LOCUS773 [Hexamita inflata]CAI9914850.1 Hypothetical protein HINF_LOCUS2495 [Hexamita inflata]